MSSFCAILLYNSWQQCHVISPPPYPLINRTLTPSFHSTSDWSAETGSVWLHQSIGGLQRGRWCHLMLLTHRSHEISLQQTPSLPEIPSWDSVCVCLCCGDIIGNLSWCQTTFWGMTSVCRSKEILERANSCMHVNAPVLICASHISCEKMIYPPNYIYELVVAA